MSKSFCVPDEATNVRLSLGWAEWEFPEDSAHPVISYNKDGFRSNYIFPTHSLPKVYCPFESFRPYNS